MGCSSCQQNNHVVPSTHVHNPTTQTHCECACGCSEPVCPTPQPCTEITDSRCIIYTDAVIKCGNDTVVTQNASVSTALNQLAAYFCSKQGLVTTEVILCDDVIIVPAGTDVQSAFELVVQFICNIQLIPGPAGAVGPQGPAGTNAYKFVHEELSVFDGDTITILRQSLEYCSLLPFACSDDVGFVDELCDLHVSVYYEFAGNWKKIPIKPFGILGTEGYELGINATTGDLTITLTIAPISPAVRVRVVILA
jgi:hypothetical protein